MKNIVILGAGDFGKEVAWLIEDLNKTRPEYRLLGFLDDDENKKGQEINGYKCLGPIGMLTDLAGEQDVCAVIAVQDGAVRKNVVDRFPGFNRWETLVHPTVNLSGTSELGKGCIVCANCNISVNTRINDHVIMNLAVTMGHDCDIDDYVSIMSGAVVSGHVSIGKGAYLGSSSTVLPGMKVGPGAVVGAGSVVIRNVKDGATVMGVPAKVLRV